MSDLGDLLELIHTAHFRPLAIRATIRHWTDAALFQESMRRWGASSGPGSSMTLMAIDRVGADPEGPSGELYRVWHRRPGSFWRIEHELHGKTNLTIINGNRWWGGGLADETWTNVRPDGSIADNVGGDVPRPVLRTMLYPRMIAAMTILTVAGTPAHLGRETVSVTGTLEVDERTGGHLFDLGAPYADSLNILIDRETGVVMRLGLVLDGQEFLICEMEDVDFVPALDESLFVGPPDARLPTLPPMPDLARAREDLQRRIRRATREQRD